MNVSSYLLEFVYIKEETMKSKIYQWQSLYPFIAYFSGIFYFSKINLTV